MVSGSEPCAVTISTSRDDYLGYHYYHLESWPKLCSTPLDWASGFGDPVGLTLIGSKLWSGLRHMFADISCDNGFTFIGRVGGVGTHLSHTRRQGLLADTQAVCYQVFEIVNLK